MINHHRIIKKIPEQAIRQQVKKIAQDITKDFQDSEPTLIGVLNGVFIFFSDLVREISIPLKIDFVRLASYGSKDVSSGTITFTKDVELPLKGKPVIIVEYPEKYNE